MKKIVVLLLISVFISCNSDDDNNTPFEPVNVSFTTLGQRSLGGNDVIPQSNLVIKNQNDWDNLLAEMNANGNVTDDLLTTTSVNFNNNYVIAIFLGEKPVIWKVEITEIIENEETLNVYIIDFAQIGDAISRPFHIVEIPKIDKPVVFEFQ